MRRSLIYAAIFVAAFGTYLTRVTRAGTLADPPETGDGHDFDALAFNIWHGRGYGFDWDDPQFRQPYEGLARFEPLLQRHSSFHSTTYRPPGMPLLLAAVYALTDRSFAVWRVLNCAVVAGAILMAAAVAGQFGGTPAAILTAGLGLYSPWLSRFAGLFMTEGLAAFLLTLTVWLWVTNAREGWTRRRTIAAGVTFGALMATRSIFVLFMPVVLLLPGTMAGAPGVAAWRAKVSCLGVALLVIAPWWVRNIVVTRSFMPLGSQGALNLPAGFGPRALANEGLWASNHEDGADRPFIQSLDPTRWEVELGRIRMRLAVQWMRRHFREVVQLMYLHVWQEIRPRGHLFTDLLLPAAVAGIVVLRRVPGVAVIVLIVGANLASIAMTWSAAGLFMIPLQPVLMAVIGAATATLSTRLTVRRKAVRQAAAG